MCAHADGPNENVRRERVFGDGKRKSGRALFFPVSYSPVTLGDVYLRAFRFSKTSANATALYIRDRNVYTCRRERTRARTPAVRYEIRRDRITHTNSRAHY